MQNPCRFALLLTGLVVMATSCPSATVLNRDRAEEIKVFGGQAVDGSTSFLKGAPVGALTIGRRLETQISKNPQIAAFMNRYAPRMKQQLSAVRLQDYTGCGQPLEGSEGGGDFSDADQDDIPVSPNGGAFKYTFSTGCSKIIEGDTFAISGSITLKDSDDSSKASGYSFSADNFKLTYTATVDNGNGGTITGSVSLTLNGTDTITATPVIGVFKNAQNSRLNFDASAGTDFVKATFSTTSNLEYAADFPTGDPFSQGYVNSSSKFSYDLSAKIGSRTASFNSSFNLKLVNVFINRKVCVNNVTDSGLTGKDAAVIFSDDSNNILTWNITPATSSSQCGTGVWSLNGTPL